MMISILLASSILLGGGVPDRSAYHSRHRSRNRADYERSPIWGVDPVRVARFGPVVLSRPDAKLLQDRIDKYSRPPVMTNQLQFSIPLR